MDRRSATRIAIEVGSIVLGVLLALAVSEWAESRNNHERMLTALSNVRSELQGNLAVLETVHANNVSLVALLEAEPSGDDKEGDFLPGLQISDAAWQALNVTGLANYVDYDLLVIVSDCYSIVDIYRTTSWGLVDANLAVLAAVTADGRRIGELGEQDLFARNFLAQFQLIVSVESALIDAHKKAIEKLSASLDE